MKLIDYTYDENSEQDPGSDFAKNFYDNDHSRLGEL